MDGAADDPVLADTPMSRIGEKDTEQAYAGNADAKKRTDAASSELPDEAAQDGVVFPEGDGAQDARRDMERGA